MPTRARHDRLETVLALASRVFVWGLLFFILYVLRSFFLLIFLTFVFGYIQATGVARLQHRISNRVTCVVLFGVSILLVLLAIGGFLVPKFKEQAQIFTDSYPKYIQTLDNEFYKVIATYPIVARALHHEELSSPVSPELAWTKELGGPPTNIDSTPNGNQSPTVNLVNQLFGMDTSPGEAISAKPMLQLMRNVGSSLLAIGSAFMLSLLFSFLIVLDLPALTESVRTLADTRLEFVYEEVAGSIRDFAVVVGRALEAQLFIGILNTVLTSIGLIFMGLGDQLAFLAVIVFVCSFIPVAGAFISSTPIFLVAFQESGFGLVMIGVAMICIIHFVEAYILNPRIYGHHMRMNPVIVLIILTIGGKLFHVWGLVLGVPVCNYLFGHAIQRRSTMADLPDPLVGNTETPGVTL